MDDIILNKSAIIERCISRIKSEYFDKDSNFLIDFTRQDSVILNIERAIQASIDIGTHIIRINQYGVPQSSRDIFQKLSDEKVISSHLGDRMQKMVGFRNISVHDYQKLNIEIVMTIVEKHLADFEEFKRIILAYFK